ncbi:HdeD family acid-resistance protein [Roseococcus sp. YIM B11640]|uniref:HdeD family acid-resistance protein n=1 Tax=Roseococcus sp. YIM B11640 TaxID=3133973 RepID=UPI003C7AF6AA
MPVPMPLLGALAQNWWLILLKGICAVIFGVLTFAWPGVTIITLVMLYGIYALVDGVFSLWAAVGGGGQTSRWWLALVGVMGLLAGLIAIFLPGMTAILLLWCIAAWAIVTGIFQIMGAISLRKQIDNEWALIAAGALSVALGIFMMIQPAAGALALVFVIGAYAILYGLLLIAFSFRLKKHAPA